MNKLAIGGLTAALTLAFAGNAYSETKPEMAVAGGNATNAVKPVVPVKPYRTFIAIQRYNMEQSGDPAPISNVRITIEFPNKSKVELPEGGQYWPIGNGQVQEINRTFELPWQYIQGDGFKFTIQMHRKGADFLPCQYEVSALSEFNRAYVCHTDLGWQTTQKIPVERQDKEGIQIRVFTDRNSRPSEIPNNSIALR